MRTVATLLGGAALAASGPAVTLPAPVTAVVVTGDQAALVEATAGSDCTHVVLWSVGTRTLIRLGRPHPCGPATSTGRGLAGVALAGGRALWLTYTGGNIREWSLWTASATAPQPRRLRFVSGDVDGPQPVVTGPGSASLLPYAVGDEVVALRPNGSRAFGWRAPARVTAVAAGGSELWAALADGRVFGVLADRTAHPDRPFSGAPTALVATAAGLVAQVGGSVELHADGTTASRRLPAGARLLGAESRRIVYRAAGRVHVYDFASGRDVAYTAVAGALAGGRLFLAAGRSVTSRPSP